MTDIEVSDALPSSIQKAAIALVLSCVSTLLGVYFDGIEIDGLGFNDPLILGTNIIWALVVAWMIVDLLYRRKDIRLTILFVGVVILAFLVWDLVDFGFGLAQLFYAFELAMFVLAFVFLRTDASRTWYATKSS
jgi:hypothetical protein